MSLTAGTRLGPYEILAALGAGGMGEVWMARDTRLDRFVALKVLPADKVVDEERRRRFVQEAKAPSALNHPNIVTIYEIAREDGVDFIAMEYVRGHTLDRLIPRRGMRISSALKYAAQLADALAKAHAAGIMHRDLKPANIMVTEDELVKVLDFGLAKLTDTGDGSDEQVTKTIHAETQEGMIVGEAIFEAGTPESLFQASIALHTYAFSDFMYLQHRGHRLLIQTSRMCRNRR